MQVGTETAVLDVSHDFMKSNDKHETSQARFRVGVDVGGTHTDLVLVDEETGNICVNKVPTIADDPARATVEGLRELVQAAGVALDSVDYFMHGTTIATNIVVQHDGARCGMITTEGFRDILHIARSKRPSNFSLQLDLPWQKHPLVARRHRLPVPERICGPHGEVLKPLDEDAVQRAARELRDSGVESIAVCFLFSYLNPRHERRAVEIVAEECPGVFVCASHEVMAQYREFERFATTALNAYVGPRTVGYVHRLENSLGENGLRCGLHLMQSNGGCATVAGIARRPVTLLMSGPVAGLIGGMWAGRLAGETNVISLDVGGTSADIGVAVEGELRVKHVLDTRIGDYHAMVPMADVDTIGAGGGSIAYVDPGGQFQVGPKSAGAEPGPACYRQGGTEVTVTDCQLALGRIGAQEHLGGRVALDPGLSRAALETKLAGPLGMTVEQAALGAIKIACHNMIQAIEVNSVRKGYDPREFALVAFGGAGPLFAFDIAAEIGIPRLVIPVYPGITSALGLLATDVSYDFARTDFQKLGNADLQRLSDTYAALEHAARAQLDQDGIALERMTFTRYADCRYEGQGYEVRAPAPAGALDESFVGNLRASFERAHRREYGSVFAEKDVEVVNLHVAGVGRITDPAPREIPSGGSTPPDSARTGMRDVVFEIDGEARACPSVHYARAGLLAGNRIEGPAVVSQLDSTTVIPPGAEADVDRFGNLVASLAVPNARARDALRAAAAHG